MGDRDFAGGLFGRNCTILWFIILFLLLFWQPFGFGYGAGVAAVKE
jgi:hypothetical protein